jgi:hypothetical protein
VVLYRVVAQRRAAPMKAALMKAELKKLSFVAVEDMIRFRFEASGGNG